MPALPATRVQRKTNKAPRRGQARAGPCRDVVTGWGGWRSWGETHASWPEEKGDPVPPWWGVGEVDR